MQRKHLHKNIQQFTYDGGGWVWVEVWWGCVGMCLGWIELISLRLDVTWRRRSWTRQLEKEKEENYINRTYILQIINVYMLVFLYFEEMLNHINNRIKIKVVILLSSEGQRIFEILCENIAMKANKGLKFCNFQK